MSDFMQSSQVTTIHDLGTIDTEKLEQLLDKATRRYKIGLVLPVTASDMRAEPFSQIIAELTQVNYLHHITVVLGVAPDVEDYRQCQQIVSQLGERATVIWTDGPRVTGLYGELIEAGFHLGTGGKGRSAWTAFAHLIRDRQMDALVLHDCDIVGYDRKLLARLCLPMAHPSLDFDFCKAYYSRVTDRMHGRVVRLLMYPLMRALISVLGHDSFLTYVDSFRYPLSGEFAVTTDLARSNRIPSDWGLEVGTLAEVFRNTSVKKVCQVDLGVPYEHKHQNLSLDDPEKGLMKMCRDILLAIFRTLASRGMVFHSGVFVSIRASYLRAAQDAIRQYHADALVNGLKFDRHQEEQAVEGFASQIVTAGEAFQADPGGAEAIPNLVRVLSNFPDFPHRLHEAATEDATEFPIS